MDAVAVSAARGLVAPRVTRGDALRVGVVFGGLQALMPVGGWALGVGLGSLIQAIDHWVAFVILGVLGARMLWAAFHDEPAVASQDMFSWRALLPLGLATSIDALAAGITLPLVGAPLVPSIVCIGLVTGVLSALALLGAGTLGARAGRRLDVLGGVALIGIGTKILIEHLSSGI